MKLLLSPGVLFSGKNPRGEERFCVSGSATPWLPTSFAAAIGHLTEFGWWLSREGRRGVRVVTPLPNLRAGVRSKETGTRFQGSDGFGSHDKSRKAGFIVGSFLAKKLTVKKAFSVATRA